MSDIELEQLEIVEELNNMPSGEVTDTDNIPDQKNIPDFGEE